MERTDLLETLIDTDANPTQKEKHTPGPWTRGHGNFVHQLAGGSNSYQGKLLAVCSPTTKTKDDWDEVFANAQLMAAAPALLQALKKAYFLMLCIDEEKIECPKLLETFKEIVKETEDAIGSARGEQ